MKRTVVVSVAALIGCLVLTGCAKKSDVQQMLDERVALLADQGSVEAVESQAQGLMEVAARQGAEIDSLRQVVYSLQSDLTVSQRRVKALEKSTTVQAEQLRANLEGLDQQTATHLSEAETRWNERLAALAQSQAATDQHLIDLQTEWREGREALESRLYLAQKRDPLTWPALAAGVLSLGLYGLHVSQ